jgi:DNA-binding response OmpR family regulator
LEAQPGWSVCAEAATGYEAVALALEHLPDLVIAAISLPGLNGLDATRQIRRGSPESEVLILTMHNSVVLSAEAFEAGARGYLLKTDNLRLFVTAVETVAETRPFLSGSVAGVGPGQLTTSDGGAAAGSGAGRHLSSREREVVQFLVEDDEISLLVGTLHKTQQRLRKVAGRGVDAITLPDGNVYFLLEAQESLRRTQEARDEAAALQATLLNTLPAHIALIDQSGVIVSVNEGWRRFSESKRALGFRLLRGG